MAFCHDFGPEPVSQTGNAFIVAGRDAHDRRKIKLAETKGDHHRAGLDGGAVTPPMGRRQLDPENRAIHRQVLAAQADTAKQIARRFIKNPDLKIAPRLFFLPCKEPVKQRIAAGARAVVISSTVKGAIPFIHLIGDKRRPIRGREIAQDETLAFKSCEEFRTSHCDYSTFPVAQAACLMAGS